MSLEAPQIFRLIHRINVAQTPQELRETLMDPAHGLDEDDIRAFFIFCSGKLPVITNTAGMIHWHNPLAWSIGMIHWHDPLAWSIGMIHWHDPLALAVLFFNWSVGYGHKSRATCKSRTIWVGKIMFLSENFYCLFKWTIAQNIAAWQGVFKNWCVVNVTTFS